MQLDPKRAGMLSIMAALLTPSLDNPCGVTHMPTAGHDYEDRSLFLSDIDPPRRTEGCSRGGPIPPFRSRDQSAKTGEATTRCRV